MLLYSMKTILQAYRGLSGIKREPAARIPPIMHCTKSGSLQERSESRKEEAYPIHYKGWMSGPSNVRANYTLTTETA